MMKSKVMIKAVFPSTDREYDVKIPVNEIMWKVNKLIVKAVYDMNGIPVDIKEDNFVMINRTTGTIYDNNTVVIDSDIRNGTEIVFIKEKKV